MEKGRFTPGDWVLPHFADASCGCNCGYVLAEGYCGAVAEVFVDNGKRVGEEGGNDCPPLGEAVANAHLIASAPKLFHALARLVQEVSNLVEEGTLPESAYQHPSYLAAKKALHEATGRKG